MYENVPIYLNVSCLLNHAPVMYHIIHGQNERSPETTGRQQW